MSTARRARASTAPPPVDTARPSLSTEGQRLLLEVPGSLAELAGEIGSSRQTVANWRNGLKAPDAEYRARMYNAWAIPPDAWAMSPSQKSARPAPAPAPAISTTAEVIAQVREAGTPTTMEDCLALLQVIRAQRNRDGLHPAERIKLADTEARILALRHRLEKEHELLEDRVVREHPAWKRLKRAMVRALVPFPDAARAVADVIAAEGM